MMSKDFFKCAGCGKTLKNMTEFSDHIKSCDDMKNHLIKVYLRAKENIIKSGRFS